MRRSLLALAAVLVAACEAPRAAGPVIGRPAPEYQAVALEGGGRASLSSLRGNAVLLNVWATWCHPCREEMPDLQRLHQQHSARGLRVVGVSIDERGQDDVIRAFLRDYGVTYPIWLDPDDRVSSTFALIGVPGTFLIDRKGTLLWSRMGPVSSEDPALRKLLDEALRAE